MVYGVFVQHVHATPDYDSNKMKEKTLTRERERKIQKIRYLLNSYEMEIQQKHSSQQKRVGPTRTHHSQAKQSQAKYNIIKEHNI